MKELELYIHIPFCVRKCKYCDFLSAPAGRRERQEYVDSLCERSGLTGTSRRLIMLSAFSLAGERRPS